ncbi:MAG: IPTL-CTERM sorting domain-containing protein [Proteobacteria bacterium]|nr:IPTL-CTERM sorting domain-containing protein [Pseudomonadota bacterium]
MPTLSQWSLALLSLLAAGAVGLHARRSRRR